MDPAVLEKKPLCANCLKTEDELASLKLCSGCGTVKYCSRTCQVDHWKGGHKNRCRGAATVPTEIISQGPVKGCPGLPMPGEEECPICLEALPQCPVKRHVLPCKHAFHRACVEALRARGVHQACPLCRAELPPSPAKTWECATRRYYVVEHRVAQHGWDWTALPPCAKAELADVVRCWEEAAMGGHALAQVSLGNSFLTGLCGALGKDPAKGEAFLAQAAHQGNAQAQYNLGSLLFERRQRAMREKAAEAAAAKTAASSSTSSVVDPPSSADDPSGGPSTHTLGGTRVMHAPPPRKRFSSSAKGDKPFNCPFKVAAKATAAAASASASATLSATSRLSASASASLSPSSSSSSKKKDKPFVCPMVVAAKAASASASASVSATAAALVSALRPLRVSSKPKPLPSPPSPPPPPPLEPTEATCGGARESTESADAAAGTGGTCPWGDNCPCWPACRCGGGCGCGHGTAVQRKRGGSSTICGGGGDNDGLATPSAGFACGGKRGGGQVGSEGGCCGGECRCGAGASSCQCSSGCGCGCWVTSRPVVVARDEGPADPELARVYALWSAAGEQDHPQALFNVGLMYRQGMVGGKADEARCLDFWRRASEHGHKQAAEYMKCCLENVAQKPAP